MYANWDREYGDQIEGLYVEGIFVDETHNHFDDGRMSYLERLKCFVKDEVPGLRGDRLVSSPRLLDMSPLTPCLNPLPD